MNSDKTLEVKYNKTTKDYYIELPDSLLKEMSWNIGDELNFIDNKDGSFTIKK